LSFLLEHEGKTVYEREIVITIKMAVTVVLILLPS